MALLGEGSVAAVYSGFRGAPPASRLMSPSEMSTPVALVCLRDAFCQPGKVVLELWEWHIG